MSGLQPNSLTLYLRPIENIQPYRVIGCAKWLVQNGKFKTLYDAMTWLNVMAAKQPFIYKAILSDYFNAVDYKQDFLDKRDVNKYRSSATNLYGEEAHMWY
jgi:hypothetical protein